ncbi:beta-catenin-interacting protein 1 isoform X1 [Rhinatrema bivittatum]|uniref:beta-catenin-interacting protein 1 isoform X1 n=1 Tax=Rhinatrema bivittatum TaxID=194408 RepID=UPI001126F02B|nr:beta-catenin-interacting protein 1 isoform X1 [Rhinatrema bivittatum]
MPPPFPGRAPAQGQPMGAAALSRLSSAPGRRRRPARRRRDPGARARAATAHGHARFQDLDTLQNTGASHPMLGVHQQGLTVLFLHLEGNTLDLVLASSGGAGSADLLLDFV